MDFGDLVRNWALAGEFPSPAALERSLTYLRTTPETLAPKFVIRACPELFDRLVEEDSSANLVASALNGLELALSKEEADKRISSFLVKLENSKLYELAQNPTCSFSLGALEPLLQDSDPIRCLSGLALLGDDEFYYYEGREIFARLAPALLRIDIDLARVVEDLAPLHFNVLLMLADAINESGFYRKVSESFTQSTQLGPNTQQWETLTIMLKKGLLNYNHLSLLCDSLTQALGSSVEVSSGPRDFYDLALELPQCSNFIRSIKLQAPAETLLPKIEAGNLFSDRANWGALLTLGKEIPPSTNQRFYLNLFEDPAMTVELSRRIFQGGASLKLGELLLAARGPEFTSETAVALLKEDFGEEFSILSELLPIETSETLLLRAAEHIFGDASLESNTENVSELTRSEFLYSLGCFLNRTGFQMSPTFTKLLGHVFKHEDARRLFECHIVTPETVHLISLSDASSLPDELFSALFDEALKSLGDDPRAWETFSALLPGFTGTLEELLSSVASLK